jgi:hypothetical protein
VSSFFFFFVSACDWILLKLMFILCQTCILLRVYLNLSLFHVWIVK